MDRRKPAKGARRPSMAAVIATGDGTAGGSSHISASTSSSSHFPLFQGSFSRIPPQLQVMWARL